MSHKIKRNANDFNLPETAVIRGAYKMARLINHQQGFKLMELASESYGWKLNFSDIARIWSNGCIIKSHLMNSLHDGFKTERDLFQMNVVFTDLLDLEEDLRAVIHVGLDLRMSLHCFTAAYYYWIDMTSERLPANLIQAQRDFFGAHTYQRIDDKSGDYYHTKW